MSLVIYEVKDHLAYITMNRPEKLNAINQEVREELFSALRDVKSNPEVWVTIITGVGRAFSTGGDLVGYAQKHIESEDETADALYVYLSEIWKPVIAAINGYCLAQGAGIALLSDIRIASDKAQFAWPHVKRGISSVSGPALLPHLMPVGLSLEYLFTGEPFSAQEALRWGIVNRVVTHEQLMPTAEAVARRILANAPLAVRSIKEASIRTLGLKLRDRVAIAKLGFDKVLPSLDAQEGLRAFAEKRTPVWRGE